MYSIGNVNPIRYRGYYYDAETGFYYLQSRYYDPETCRFINADDSAMVGVSPDDVLSNNLFAYCSNNPVMNEDPSGLASIWSLKSDWAGRQILSWYLTGGGKKRLLYTKQWAQYMKDNKILKNKVRKILQGYSKNAVVGKEIHLIRHISMEIENGEDIIGYQYLHGTNASVGGFQIEVYMKKDSKGNVKFITNYRWNDIIDPNYKYESDKKKALLADIITFGQAKPYVIAIHWSDTSVLSKNNKWTSGWLK